MFLRHVRKGVNPKYDGVQSLYKHHDWKVFEEKFTARDSCLFSFVSAGITAFIESGISILYVYEEFLSKERMVGGKTVKI